MLDDDLFHDLDRHVGVVVDAVLAAPAEEIVVDATVPAFGALDDEAGFAAVAPQQPFEVVRVAAVADAGAGVGVEHALYGVEGFFVDQGFVPAFVLDVFVGDVADVVAVAQQVGQGLQGDGLAVVRHAQPGFGELGLQAGDDVLAGGEQLEGHGDVLFALRVGDDGVDAAAVDLYPAVEVAELGFAEGAAIFGLVGHFDGDVLAVAPDLDLVHDVGDGFHGVGPDALAEVFTGGDELDAHLGQLPLGDGGVGEVAERSGAHVDEHIFYLRVLLEVLEQLPEDLAFGDALGAGAWLDELFLQHDPHAFGLGLAVFPLGVDRVAVRVNVCRGVHLPGRGDAQVGDAQLKRFGLCWRLLVLHGRILLKPRVRWTMAR
ncbi:MAG TPA: hypothetical protein VLJ59_16820 [Mycobacteriales bacterium]|nr:hypothetical protein [Mycobacteriales bacterium]